MKPTADDPIKALGKLDPLTVRRTSLTEAEGAAAIEARRRGISVARIAQALGLTRQGFSTALCTWALRHAVLPKKERR